MPELTKVGSPLLGLNNKRKRSKAVHAAAAFKRHKQFGSANRVLQVLSLFATGPAQLTVDAIASAIGAPRSSTYRYVKLLKDAGFIVDNGAGHLEVAPLAIGLVRNSRLAGKLIAIARPIMQKLTQGSRELTLLVKRSGHFGVCVESVESRMPIRYTFELGATFPLHQPGALRRSLLAHASIEEQEAILNHAMRLDPQFKPQKTLLRRELELIRQRGYAESLAEITPDLWGISVPILHNGLADAALVLLAPAHRMSSINKSRFRSAVRGAAKDIEDQLFDSPANVRTNI